MAGLSLSDIRSQETEAVEAVARCYVSKLINIELDLSVYIYIRTYTSMYACTHTQLHIYIHTYIHRYTHEYIVT